MTKIVSLQAAFRALRIGAVAALSLAIPASLAAQSTETERPVPVLTGSLGFFTNGWNGQTQLEPVATPVLLVPLGERWLVESRGEVEGDFRRPAGGGAFGGTVTKEVDYAQVDFIANANVTVTAGRFLTPFGMYNERMYPIWIRDLQPTPLIFPIGTGSSDGMMLRGGLPASRVNVNYAVYFSTLSTIHKLDSDRLTGARVGFFLPGPRVEIGGSFQQLLQEERSRSVGFHFAWQPNRVPLNLRSEYAWSGSQGSGYWIEAAYRLNQAQRWQRVLRHTEVVARGQQYFAGELAAADAAGYGLPTVNARQADLGLNYYFSDGLKATSSYGRRFSASGDVDLWTVGIAYRFALPLGRTQ